MKNDYTGKPVSLIFESVHSNIWCYNKKLMNKYKLYIHLFRH